jgi:hypothetical protein
VRASLWITPLFSIKSVIGAKYFEQIIKERFQAIESYSLAKSIAANSARSLFAENRASANG